MGRLERPSFSCYGGRHASSREKKRNERRWIAIGQLSGRREERALVPRHYFNRKKGRRENSLEHASVVQEGKGARKRILSLIPGESPVDEKGGKERVLLVAL